MILAAADWRAELFLLAAYLTISVSPASPTAGSAAEVTISGPSACTTVNVDFGDGTSQTFMRDAGPPITNAHTWTTSGTRTVTAAGQGGACLNQGATSITVLTPPAVTVTAPTAGATYFAPATIDLSASATAAQGTITRVDFYANGGLIGTDTTAPYTYAWPGVGNGTYTLTARATDSAGASATSAGVTVVVGEPPPSTVLGVTITPHPVAAGQAATITVTGTNPCTMLWMDFGDGYWWIAPIDSLPFTTTHTWAAGGTYTVLARGYISCEGEVTKPVTVTGAPAPEALAVGESFAFDASVLPSADDAWLDLEVPGSGPWVGPEEGALAPQSTVSLTVDLAGTGSGTVTTSPGGVVCSGAGGQTCSGEFAAGTLVTLTAAPAAGSTFAGWGGACSGTTSCTVTLASARLVVATFTVPPPFVTQYYHVDALGSVRAVTDASGAVVRTHNYYPFGEGVGVDSGTDPMRFTGKPRDRETGLDYFGARYYSQGAGRFTTVDPLLDMEAALFEPQRWNRHAYALNSPFAYVDPDGRNPKLIHRLLQTPLVQRILASPAIRPIVRAAERASDRLLDVVIRAPRPQMTPEVGRSISASTIETALASGAEAAGRQGTAAFRALASHIDRGDPAFQGVAKTAESALGLIRSILSDPSRIAAGQKTIDIYNAAGQGVRLELQTGKFITFLDVSKATR